MTASLKVYLDIAAAIVAALVVVAWSIRRKRQDRLAIDRIEPDAADKASADLTERLADRCSSTNEAPAFADEAPAHSRPEPANPKPLPSRSELEPFAARGALSAGDYKGFEICLNERRPGLWIAAVKGSPATNTQDPAHSPEFWTTGEFYQSWAALAEAKAAIDRRGRGSPGPAPARRNFD